MRAFFETNNNRITVYNLPSYSPDFNPIEKLWKKIKECGTHLKYFPTFDSLKATVNDMLVRFEKIGKEVLNLFGFYKKKWKMQYDLLIQYNYLKSYIWLITNGCTPIVIVEPTDAGNNDNTLGATQIVPAAGMELVN